jgi:hypothetical protein
VARVNNPKVSTAPTSTGLRPKAIRQATAQRGTHHEADVADCEHQTELGRSQGEIAGDPRRDNAECLDVKAFEHRDRKTQCDGQLARIAGPTCFHFSLAARPAAIATILSWTNAD